MKNRGRATARKGESQPAKMNPAPDFPPCAAGAYTVWKSNVAAARFRGRGSTVWKRIHTKTACGRVCVDIPEAAQRNRFGGLTAAGWRSLRQNAGDKEKGIRGGDTQMHFVNLRARHSRGRWPGRFARPPATPDAPRSGALTAPPWPGGNRVTGACPPPQKIV